MNEIFGYKVMQGGKHTLITGHVKTKDGNVEFSGVLDATDILTLWTTLHKLSGSLQSIKLMADCYHHFQLVSSDTGGDDIVRCSSCQLQKPCPHEASHLVSGVWNEPDAIYECQLCKLTYTYEGEGISKIKVPYRRPTTPDVRPASGTGSD